MRYSVYLTSYRGITLVLPLANVANAGGFLCSGPS